MASFTTKNVWTDVDGTQRQVRFALDNISPFSSPGPLRKGQEKPDVTAAGAAIASALSADSGPDRAFILSPTMRIDMGTSMATPFITGVVALLLQQQNDLTPAVVKQRLKAASRVPNKPTNTFDEHFGFGLIDGGLL